MANLMRRMFTKEQIKKLVPSDVLVIKDVDIDIEQGTFVCDEKYIKQVIDEKPAIIKVLQQDNNVTSFMITEGTEHEVQYVVTLYDENVISSIHIEFAYDDVAIPHEYTASCYLAQHEFE